ncbi:MAG TPA: PilZ domain-containing protein [Nitrospiria bacterium]|jgi:hypothetical protein
MKERRKGKRVVITCVAEVTSLSKNVDLEGYVTNISRIGLGMMTRKKLDEGDEVIVKLNFFGMNGVNEVENVRGRVKRVAPLANVFSVGIQFEIANEKEASHLFAYIDAAEKSL